ncbi:hypothetical protein RB653_004175 [Dictyostelium firmibasis]|uniref:phospholipase D n=1 Tax=Dictyostelium firmibasis TaxID=79012 RepID=A0AAN7Z348_9MYCE
MNISQEHAINQNLDQNQKNEEKLEKKTINKDNKGQMSYGDEEVKPTFQNIVDDEKLEHQNDEDQNMPNTDVIERKEVGVIEKINNEDIPIIMSDNAADYKVLQHNLKKGKVSKKSKEEIEKISQQEEKDMLEYLKNYRPNDEFTIQLEDQLSFETYFSRDELHLLYREFKKNSKSGMFMSKEDFISSLTPFSSNSDLTISLMNAIDRNGDQKIAFPEFVQALSIMCRGIKKERLRFTFEICDFNGDSLVSRDEVYSTVKSISDIFLKFGYSKDKFGDASEAVDSVFSSGLTTNGVYLHNKKELSLNEFLERGELNPDLSKCFGMFDYFYLKFIGPIDLLFRDQEVNMDGQLTKIKPKTIFNFNISHRRTLSLRDGFLIVFKKKKLKHDEDKPSKVIFLPGSTVKVVIGSQPSKKKKFLSKKFHNYYGFRVTKGNYNRFFLMENRDEALNWVNAIRFHSRQGFRFQSFSKVRVNIGVEWFINGSSYYNELAETIRRAKHEIYITGWWVSPYVYLQRDNGVEHMEKSRLDRVLTEKAKEGVKVYVLMWNETNLGVQLGSRHAKNWLEGCHSNIHVIRHPKRYPLSWSHHQKNAIIDQQIAFVGGIDICLMRYETSKFQLTDNEGKRFPGKDYGNLLGTVIRTGDPKKDQFDRRECPRMPWHDVHTKIVGPSAKDVASNFIQRWNHAIYVERANKFQPLLIPKDYTTEKPSDQAKPDKWRNLVSNIRKGFTHVSYGREKPTHYQRAGDNPKVRKYTKQGAFGLQSDQIDNKVNLEDDQQNTEYTDNSIDEFDQNENGENDDDDDDDDFNEYDQDDQNTKIPFNNKPSTAGSQSNNSNNNNINNDTGGRTKKSKNNYNDLVKDEEGIELPGTPKIDLNDDKLLKSIYHLSSNMSDSCVVQLVRSISPWSAGTDVEDSCYKAYLGLIKNAQHFIYIQNLFFISSCGSKLPKNRIALAILNRVRRAITLKEKFRVIIMVPISPSGDLALASSRMIIGWTNRTISQGGQSVLELLKNEFPDVDLAQYISFNSIRQWEVNGDRIFTEQIYVHSKVLIVDDRVAVIGSCNINDRSMMGSRDSELAVVVSDQSKLLITMDGKPFKVGKFPHTLRVGLWKTHLNLTDPEISSVIDPVSDNAYINVWRNTARNNSMIYKEVFGDCILENQRRLGIQQKKFITKTNELVVQLSQIQGVLIEYPLDMFCESNLFNEQVGIFTAESYVDVSIFT